MKNNFLLTFIIFITINSCSNYIPKPYGYLRLEFPDNKYEIYNGKYFSIEKSLFSEIEINKKNDNFININYSKMNAKIHCTYKKMNNKNKNIILEDIEKFTYKHTIKAENIKEQIYENDKKMGMLFFIEGNTATNLQFYITDKEKNILSGSLYFWNHPNYDSLLPAIKYIEKDIKVIMETIKWK